MADGKQCIICGTDCTDKPRIKNSKGQYACQPCAEARRAAKAAKASSSASSRSHSQTRGQPHDQSRAAVANGRASRSNSAPRVAESASSAALMERWASSSVEGKIALGTVEQPKCPKCDHRMMPDSVVCMGCGFNTSSGKKIHTRIQKADKDKSASSGGGVSFGDGNTLGVVALLAMVGLIAGTAFAGPMGAIFILVAIAWALVSGILMIVSAFQDGDTTWGIIGLCQFVPIIGGLASLAFVFYYCTVGSTRTVRKISYWCAFIALVGSAIALVVANPEMMAEDF